MQNGREVHTSHGGVRLVPATQGPVLGGPELGGRHLESLSNVTSCMHCKLYLGAWSLEWHRAHMRWSVVLSCFSLVTRSPFVSDEGLGVNTGRIRLSWEPQLLGRGFTSLEGIPVPNRGQH